jgi:hypothetical protein
VIHAVIPISTSHTQSLSVQGQRGLEPTPGLLHDYLIVLLDPIGHTYISSLIQLLTGNIAFTIIRSLIQQSSSQSLAVPYRITAMAPVLSGIGVPC